MVRRPDLPPALTMAALLACALASGCGTTSAPARGASTRESTPSGRERAQPTPFPRVTALPAAPERVAHLEMEALRRTPLYEQVRMAMDGSSPEDVLGRRLLERTEEVEIGMYRRQREVVMIARGELDGVLDETVRELREPPARIERSGFTAYYIDEDMVAVQTAPDTVVLSYPQYLDEVLRTASGQAPAMPLPAQMRALQTRGELADAPLSLLFAVPDSISGTDALSRAVREARFAGLAARLEGDQIILSGAAELATPARAAQMAAELDRAARATTEVEVRTQELAAAVRQATLRSDERWVEFELRLPPDEIRTILDILF